MSSVNLEYPFYNPTFRRMVTTFIEQFKWINFEEHPIVDLSKDQARLFDIITNRGVGFSSDFQKSDQFNHEQYCVCLIEKLFMLSPKMLPAFFDYQLQRLLKPAEWMHSLRLLLQLNEAAFQNKIIKEHNQSDIKGCLFEEIQIS